MDELSLIIDSLCKSDYLEQWVLELKDNDVLFSPQKNVKPCQRIDEKYVRTSYWKGLDLLVEYCKRDVINSEVDDFIINLLRESIDLYINDNEIDPYKKLNSSDEIVLKLFNICISKQKYIDSVDVQHLVKEYLTSVISWPYSLVYDLYMKKDVIVKCKPNTIFEIYKAILEQKRKTVEYEEYMKIDEIVEIAPVLYYDYCKKRIMHFDFSISSMGSFFEYNGEYGEEIESIIFNIFKTSSLKMDANVLETDSKAFIMSGNTLLKKIGLYLINVNFQKLENLFFEYINYFFNDKDFYSDLKCLLINNLSIIKDEKRIKIIEAICVANFGSNDKKTIDVLKNYLFKICNQNGVDVPFIEPSSREIESVRNYNKSFYFVEHNFEEDIESIKGKISKLKIDNVVSTYKKMINSSSYFQDTVRKAFVDCFFVNTDNLIILESFDYQFAITLMRFYQDNKDFQSLYKAIKQVLTICITNDTFINCLSNILYIIISNIGNFNPKEIKDMILMIDYKWISIKEFNNSKEIIDQCMNENLYSYFDIMINLVESNIVDIDYLKEVVKYNIKHNNYHKLKALLASKFPILFLIDKDYALSIEEYVFNNVFDGINLSYVMMMFSKDRYGVLLERFSEKKDFISFLKEKDKSSDDKIAKHIIFNWYLGAFLNSNYYEEKVDIIIDNKRYDVVLDCIRWINNWIENKGNKNIEQFVKFIKKTMNSIDDALYYFSERDQLIRGVSKFILLTKGKVSITWDMIVLLFKYFDHFFSDESIELIKQYKNKKKKYIVQILNKYFDSYEQFKTYEITLKKVLNLIKNDVNYQKEKKKWCVSIVTKNPYFII